MVISVQNQEFKGIMFGVKLVHRGHNDPHICVQLLKEDDESWFKVGRSFSSFWIDDLIKQLQLAKQAIETFPKDRDGCGYEFKS